MARQQLFNDVQYSIQPLDNILRTGLGACDSASFDIWRTSPCSGLKSGAWLEDCAAQLRSSECVGVTLTGSCVCYASSEARPEFQMPLLQSSAGRAHSASPLQL